ncbi:replication-relaxation family protein [Nonomuraea sp. NPDC002799]
MSVLPIPAGQPRLDRDTLPALSARLTPRDYDILTHLHRHRVLTTHQLQRLFFGIPQSTRKRMSTLYLLNAVTCFRPWAGYGAGSAPIHWVLGKAGAAVLAVRQGISIKELGYNPDVPIAVSSRLRHQVGVNDFFSHLHHYARHSAAEPAPATSTEERPGTGTEVKAWWSEQQCAKLWGDLARPDAWGQWRENGTEIDFFLEHDTGTETLKRVADKLHDYRNLADATGINTPVLFWLPSPARETNLRPLLTGADIPVATAVHTSDGDGPAGPIWLPAGANAHQPRMRLADLADLADAWPHLPLGRIHNPPGTDQPHHEPGTKPAAGAGDEPR